jgi:hypothetical protein
MDTSLYVQTSLTEVLTDALNTFFPVESSLTRSQIVRVEFISEPFRFHSLDRGTFRKTLTGQHSANGSSWLRFTALDLIAVPAGRWLTKKSQEETFCFT